MATALDLIKRSMRLVHVLDSDEEPSAAESADALDALNTMLDTWSIPGLYIYTSKEEALTWPASTESRTIGATGDFVTTRPTKINTSTFVRTTTGEDYPVEILNKRRSYTWILDKDTEATYPQYLYYEPGHPDGTLYLWPVPGAAVTLYLHTPEQLTQFAALTTTFSWPPGYKEFMEYNLAERLADEFGVQAPQGVLMRAKGTRVGIKRSNAKHVLSNVQTPGRATRGYNIYSDM